jgi:hypothetical protein
MTNLPKSIHNAKSILVALILYQTIEKPAFRPVADSLALIAK